ESEGGTDTLTATATTTSRSRSAGSRCTWVHAGRRSSDWRGRNSCSASTDQIRKTLIRFANLCNSSCDAIPAAAPAGRFRRSKAHGAGGGCSESARTQQRPGSLRCCSGVIEACLPVHASKVIVNGIKHVGTSTNKRQGFESSITDDVADENRLRQGVQLLGFVIKFHFPKELETCFSHALNGDFRVRTDPR